VAHDNIPPPIKTCRTTHRPPKCLSPKHAAFLLSRPQRVLAHSVPREKRLRLTSQLPAGKTLNAPHHFHHHQASSSPYTLLLLPNIPCTTPPHPSTSTSIFSSSPHRAHARLPRLATGAKTTQTQTSLLIALDSTPRIARSNLTLYREPR
jgi:hypothetical protein